MSILIKGMNMPRNCSSCPLSVLCENRLFCELTSNAVVKTKIDCDCPLVPVPPHGRLIDADFVMNNMHSEHPYVQNAIRATISNAPTIISAEEG